VEGSDASGGGEEVSGEFVVTGGDTPPILDAAEVILDLVPSPVNSLGTIGFPDGGASAGNDGQSSFIPDLLAYRLAVVSFVGRNGERRACRVQNLFDNLAVMDLTARHDEVQRAALAVDDRMDFRAPPAAADADRLVLLPPFAPEAARWAFTMVESIRYRLSRDFEANLSKIFFHMPRRDQRLKRL